MDQVTEIIKNFLYDVGPWAPFLSCLFIIIESFIPILPLFLFITINFVYWGNIIGFIVSWLFTVIGCYIAFLICKKGLFKKFRDKIENKEKLDKIIKRISNISLSSLIIIISMPFTPSFLVNIAAGITQMDNKKYLIALLLGKIVCVYFSGYIGVSLIECFKNPLILIRIIILIIGFYILGRVVKRVFKIE